MKTPKVPGELLEIDYFINSKRKYAFDVFDLSNHPYKSMVIVPNSKDS